MTKTYDAIVLGAGGVGSAALLHLARRGLRVVGVDRFLPPHAHGSSHGHTRVIRQAYFEHPDYVPLLLRAFQLWRELEAESRRSLFQQVGLLEVGPPDGVVIPGVLKAAQEHGLCVEPMAPSLLRRRIPAFQAPAGMEAVFESQAGYLLVEQCIEVHLRLAIQEGAELLVAPVTKWTPTPHGVQVQTESGTLSADRLVITAGAGATKLLQDEWRAHGIRLEVLRKHLHWHPTPDPRLTAAEGFPTFFVEDEGGSFFYGFPGVDSRGVKVAEHSGGTVVGEPLTDDKSPELDDQRRVRAFLAKCFPAVDAEPADHAVCYYTMTPDGHFLVDRSRTAPQVVYAAGLSGHGFKFAPVLGEALAQLAVDGETNLATEFLSVARFSPGQSRTS